MFEFWWFTDHGIYHSPDHSLTTMRSIREFTPSVENEFIIYVSG